MARVLLGKTRTAVYAKYVFFLAGDFWRGYRKNGRSLQAAYKTNRKPS
jgi:hypothetical protein